MNKILLMFDKPYPLEERKPAQVKLALIFGVVVFLFLFFLKPLGGNQDTKDLFINSGIAGLLTFTTITFDFLVLFPLFPRYFKEEKWTIGREIILTLLIITSIATANILAGSIFWGNTISVFNWLRMIFYTAIIGIAPATISILINQSRLLKKYRREVLGINQQLTPFIANETMTPLPVLHETAAPQNQQQKPYGQVVEMDALPAQAFFNIEAENDKDNLIIPASQFLAATSADNYVKVFYHQNQLLKTAIIRTTLKRMEGNSASFPHFFRCHRTAIVNLALVEKVNGSAQGYRLQLSYLPEEIPVSRNLNQVIKDKLATTHP